jgi:hypothetical protein
MSKRLYRLVGGYRICRNKTFDRIERSFHAFSLMKFTRIAALVAVVVAAVASARFETKKSQFKTCLDAGLECQSHCALTSFGVFVNRCFEITGREVHLQCVCSDFQDAPLVGEWPYDANWECDGLVDTHAQIQSCDIYALNKTDYRVHVDGLNTDTDSRWSIEKVYELSRSSNAGGNFVFSRAKTCHDRRQMCETSCKAKSTAGMEGSVKAFTCDPMDATMRFPMALDMVERNVIDACTCGTKAIAPPPDMDDGQKHGDNQLSAGTIAGIASGTFAFVGLSTFGALYYKRYRAYDSLPTLG